MMENELGLIVGDTIKTKNRDDSWSLGYIIAIKKKSVTVRYLTDNIVISVRNDRIVKI